LRILLGSANQRSVFGLCKSLCMTGFMCVPTTSHAWTSWIAVLEDFAVESPADGAGKRTDPIYADRVRPVFMKVDAKPWEAVTDSDKETKSFSWDVCFSGRPEGSLTSVPLKTVLAPGEPKLGLRDGEKAPWRTRRSLDYAGSTRVPTYKSILLTSSLNASCKDPMKMKQASSERAKAASRKAMDSFSEQYAKSPWATTPVMGTKPIKVMGSKQSSSFLIALKSKLKSGAEVTSLWWAGEGPTQLIGWNGTYIDAGDFDGDGTTEIVVKTSSLEGDTYHLFEASDAGSQPKEAAIWPQKSTK
jgi:hypothetical protein